MLGFSSEEKHSMFKNYLFDTDSKLKACSASIFTKPSMC